MNLRDAAAVVEPLVAEAGALTLGWFRTPVDAADKGSPHGFDPVTAADQAAEAFLRERLSEAFPDHQIIGEEGGASGPADASARWIIDPIDGTKAFITGMPAWGVLVGLVVDDRPAGGWVRQPYLGETFAAVDGDGWYERGGERRPLRASATTELAAARLYSTHPSMFTTDDERAAFGRLAAAVQLQRFGGDCYSYCMLALGHIDLVVENGLHAHDIVPLIPIVEAAGGVVTNREGKPPLDGGFVIAAATTELHAQALEVLR